MVLETGFMIIEELLKLDLILLFFLLLIAVFVAYKVFKFVFKALIVGIAFAAFPFIANLFGFGIPITLNNIMWSAFFGIILFIIYGAITMSYKLTAFVFRPFRRVFSKKPQDRVIIREYQTKGKEEKD